MLIGDGGYKSPRLSTEVRDCALPLTFDQHSRCSYGCLYCFAAMQRCNQGLGAGKAFKEGKVSSVNVQEIKDTFQGRGKGKKNIFLYNHLIRYRIPLHWGGLGDPADNYEKKSGVGLELLKFFREIDYPVFICHKGDAYYTRPEYAEVFKGAKNFALQFSIIGLNEEKCPLLDLAALFYHWVK